MGLLLLAYLVGLVPAASAVPGELVVEARLPGQFQGTVDAASRDAEFLAQDDGGVAAGGIAAERLTLTRVEVATFRPVPPIEGLEMVSQVRRDAASHDRAALRLLERLDGYAFHLRGEAQWGLSSLAAPPASRDDLDPNVFWGALATPLLVASHEPPSGAPVRVPLGGEERYEHSISADSHQVLSSHALVTADGALQGFVQGARLALSSAAGSDEFTLDSGWETKEGSVYVPGLGWLGEGTHEEHVARYAEVSAEEARFRYDARGSPASLFAASVRFDVQGALSLPWARGRLDAAEETVELAPGPLLLEGVMSFQPVKPFGPRHDRTAFRAQGDFTYVSAPGVERAWDSRTVVAAVSLTALLAAAAAWFFTKGPGLAALLPLYARVHKEEALRHEARERIYEAVKGEPGINANALAAKFPFGWSTLLYHLKVLERNDFVIAVRDGRYRRYFDKASGRYANGRKYVVAVLRNPATHALAEAVRREPGLTQKELAARFGLAASTVHWHIARLEAVGLVEKRRDGQNVRYGPGLAWPTFDACETLLAAPVAVAAPA